MDDDKRLIPHHLTAGEVIGIAIGVIYVLAILCAMKFLLG